MEELLNAYGNDGGAMVNPPNVSDPSVNPGLNQYMQMLGMGGPNGGPSTVSQNQLAKQQPGAGINPQAAQMSSTQQGYVAPTWMGGGNVPKAGCAC